LLLNILVFCVCRAAERGQVTPGLQGPTGFISPRGFKSPRALTSGAFIK